MAVCDGARRAYAAQNTTTHTHSISSYAQATSQNNTCTAPRKATPATGGNRRKRGAKCIPVPRRVEKIRGRPRPGPAYCPSQLFAVRAQHSGLRSSFQMKSHLHSGKGYSATSNQQHARELTADGKVEHRSEPNPSARPTRQTHQKQTRTNGNCHTTAKNTTQFDVI